MHWFFDTHISLPLHRLNADESRHCSAVLRLRKGDQIFLTDGKGSLHTATITEPDPRATLVSVTASRTFPPETTCRIHLAVSPPKNTDRFEWFLEKATEIGIDRVTPLLCSRSERKVLRTDRLPRVLVAAIKQSKRTYLPVVSEMTGFSDFILENAGKGIFLATREAKEYLAAAYPGKTDVRIMVGPEGDFSPEEMAFAMEKGVVPVKLGEFILRTETAAIACLQTIHTVNRRLSS